MRVHPPNKRFKWVMVQVQATKNRRLERSPIPPTAVCGWFRFKLQGAGALAPSPNPANGSWRMVQVQATRSRRLGTITKSHQRQLVDCSGSSYKEPVPWHDRQIPPTAVGGLFRSCLWYGLRTVPRIELLSAATSRLDLKPSTHCRGWDLHFLCKAVFLNALLCVETDGVVIRTICRA